MTLYNAQRVRKEDWESAEGDRGLEVCTESQRWEDGSSNWRELPAYRTGHSQLQYWQSGSSYRTEKLGQKAAPDGPKRNWTFSEMGEQWGCSLE